MEYNVNFLDGYFEVKLIGKASVEDSVKYLDSLIAHQQWKLGSLVLSDEMDLKVGHLTANDLEAMARVCSDRRTAIGASRFAAFVPHDLVFGMNRMFQVYAEPFWDATIYAFRSRDEALAWLLSV